MGSDNSLSTNIDKSAQLKLTNMLNKMKNPSVPKKVDVVSLKKMKHEPSKASVESPVADKTMTQQMTELLDEVDKKHQGGRSKTESEDDSMESGTKTSTSERSERRQTLAQVHHVLGKVSKYVSEEEGKKLSFGEQIMSKHLQGLVVQRSTKIDWWFLTLARMPVKRNGQLENYATLLRMSISNEEQKNQQRCSK